jgi:hypothetical protein
MMSRPSDHNDQLVREIGANLKRRPSSSRIMLDESWNSIIKRQAASNEPSEAASGITDEILVKVGLPSRKKCGHSLAATGGKRAKKQLVLW